MATNDHDGCKENRAFIRGGKVVVGCDDCMEAKRQGLAAKYERDWQRREYARDLVQPNQPDRFVKAYGAEAARKAGYSDEQIRKYG